MFQSSTGDYREILADPKIQAVHICTPNATHHKISTDAMRAGNNELCAKLLALSSAEAKEMAALARDKGVVNCAYPNLLYHALLQHSLKFSPYPG
jgi:predicted dehydrogenase